MEKCWIFAVLLCFTINEISSLDRVASKSSCYTTKQGHFYKVRCTNLTSIPTPDMIPVNHSLVSELILTRNKISELPAGGFKHLTNLKLLDLSWSRIKHFANNSFDGMKFLKVVKVTNLQVYSMVYFERNVFQPLLSVEKLDLTNTNVNIKSLYLAICSFRNGIKFLIFNHIYQSDKLLRLDGQQTKCFKGLGLKTFNFDHNRLREFTSLKTIKNFQSVEKVSINLNRLTASSAFAAISLMALHHLKNASACCQYLNKDYKDQPWKGWIKNDTYIKYYSLLAAKHNNITNQAKMIRMNFLPNLQTVDLHNNPFIYHFYSYICWENNTLVNLDLSYSTVVTTDGPIRCFYNLRYFNLRGTRNLSLEHDSLLELVSLEVLLLGSSRFPSFAIHTEKYAYNFFRGNLKLRFLDLSHLEIERIHHLLFSRLTNLEVLILSNNKLSSVENIFTNLKSIIYLDLSFNKLLSVPYQFIFHLNNDHRVQSKYIRLKGNPIICDCEKLNKLNFIMKAKQGVVLDNVSCILQNERTVSVKVALEYMKQKCRHWDKTSLVFLCFMYPLVLIITILSSIIYRFRWKIVYAWYILSRLWLKQEENLTDYKYDVFIAYSSHDEEWVRTKLVRKLEGEPESYTICVDYRDFLPGEYIADNIVSAIEASRKTILMVTKRFLRSGWCQYESRAAEACHRTNRKKGIIAIVFPGVHAYAKKHNLLCNLLDTVTYLEWANREEDEKRFWLKLRRALGVPIQQPHSNVLMQMSEI